MNKYIVLIYIFSITSFFAAHAQQTDTTKVINLNEVIIREPLSLCGMERTPEMKENVIYKGKKTVIKI